MSKTKTLNVIDELREDDRENFYNKIISKERAFSNSDDANHWVEDIKILGLKVNVKLDIDSECDVLTISVTEKVGGTMAVYSKRLITYTGYKIETARQLLAKSKVWGKCYNVKFVVVNKLIELALGLTSCQTTFLIQRVDIVAVTKQYLMGSGI